MKSFKILLMAVLTIMSVSVFAQGKSNNEPFNTKQKSETIKSNCLIYPGAVMNQFGMYSITEPLLNLSLKERMKREVMRIYDEKTNPGGAAFMACNLSNNLLTLNHSSKEQMKMEAMLMKPATDNSSLNKGKTYLCPGCGMQLNVMKNGFTCPMIASLTSDNQVNCFSYKSSLNMSPKEKMRVEVMKM